MKIAEIKDLKIELEAVNQTLDTNKVTMASLEKRIKEKEKRLQVQETKIIDMQEDKVNQLNENETEVASQKQMYEHQLAEFRKHVQALELEHSSCKAQQSEAHSEIRHLEEQVQELSEKQSDDQITRENQRLKQEVEKQKQNVKELKELNTQFEGDSKENPV